MAFESVDADVNIVLNAEDNASADITQATRKINQEWKNMRDQQRAVERSFELNNQKLVQVTRTIGRLANTIGRIRSIYNTFLLQQIRNAQLSGNVTDAQLGLNDAIAQYGLESREAIDAQKRLTQAQEDAKPKIEDNIAQWVGYGEAIAVVTTSVVTLLPQLRAMKGLGGAGAGGAVGNLGGAGAGGIGGKGKSLLKAGGALAGAGLVFAGISTSQFANPDQSLSFEQKLGSVGESALGGALLGATIGSVVPVLGTAVGAGVGGAVGAGVGVATNFGDEISAGVNGIVINIQSTTSEDLVADLQKGAEEAFAFLGGG